MKISTKGRYGLEAIVDLAIHSAQGHVNLKSIAERCGMSEAYILQIFLVLRRAGIVDSIRGAQGGYVLAKAPSQITAGDVLIALEGPLAPVACVAENDEHACDRYNKCATRVFWENIMNTMNEVAHSVTIEDLVQCHNRCISTGKDSDLDYYI